MGMVRVNVKQQLYEKHLLQQVYKSADYLVSNLHSDTCDTINSEANNLVLA